MQVLSNGLVAFVSAIAFLITKNNVLVVTFVASLAEAFSDTVASGIGAFASVTYDPFRRRKCDNGISGGMSIEGTSASLVAAFLISAVAYFLKMDGYGIKEFIIVWISAFLGAVFDSMLGSLVQVKYKCEICGKITEREEHCRMATVRHSGISNIDNDVVNMISCAFASILAALIVVLI